MSRDKSPISMALKPAHLQAIGRVAAAWSNLEKSMMSAIADSAQIPFNLAIIFIAPAPFNSWLEMLIKIMEKNEKHSWKSKECRALTNTLSILYTERNAVVHAAWHVHLGVYFGGTPDERADGMTFPKRGRNTSMKPVSKTSAEIRKLSREIEVAQQGLRALYHLQKSGLQPKWIRPALRAALNLRRNKPVHRNKRPASRVATPS